MMQLLIRFMLVWAVITGATYLVSAVVSEIKQWATRRALRYVTPKEIASIIRNNGGQITSEELHQQTELPLWIAKLVLLELVDKKLLEEKYEKNEIGKRYKQFSLSVLPINNDLRFQMHKPTSTNLLAQQPTSISDAEVIKWAVEAKGRITPTRLCVKSSISIEEAAKRLDELHLKGVFDLKMNADGLLFYYLNDFSLLENG